jgi:hypothetical protein
MPEIEKNTCGRDPFGRMAVADTKKRALGVLDQEVDTRPRYFGNFDAYHFVEPIAEGGNPP